MGIGKEGVSWEDQPIGTVGLDRQCLVASQRLISGDLRLFPEDLAELMNLIELICLKTKLIVPLLSPEQLPALPIVGQLEDANDTLIQYVIDLESHIETFVSVEERMQKLKKMGISHSVPPILLFLDGMDRRSWIRDFYQEEAIRQVNVRMGYLFEEVSGLSFESALITAYEFLEVRGVAVTLELWERVYQLMADSLKASKVARRGLTFDLYIPPISFYVFSRADSPQDIIPIALDVRDGLAAFRKQYAELWLAESDGAVSDIAYYKEKRRLEGIAAKLLGDIAPDRRHLKESRLGCYAADLKELVGADSLGEILDGLDADDLSLKGLLNLLTKHPAGWLWNRFHTRKVRTLFRIGKRFSKSAGYYQVVSKLWRCELGDGERRRAVKHASASDKLLAVAKERGLKAFAKG